MTVSTFRNITLFILLSSFFINPSCKKDASSSDIDKELFDLAKNTVDIKWYKNSDQLLPKSSGTGHSEALLRTRYNSIAAQGLDSLGKIISGYTFSDGALIVKELYTSASSFNRYAILYKKPSSQYADERGWVWGYINENGTIQEPAKNKGSACNGCHSQSNNIDYMLMNKYFQ